MIGGKMKEGSGGIDGEHNSWAEVGGGTIRV